MGRVKPFWGAILSSCVVVVSRSRRVVVFFRLPLDEPSRTDARVSAVIVQTLVASGGICPAGLRGKRNRFTCPHFRLPLGSRKAAAEPIPRLRAGLTPSRKRYFCFGFGMGCAENVCFLG
jgi:hypothetical protein